MSKVPDRAELVATAIRQMIQSHFDDAALRAQLVEVLRDEFDDVARQTLNETQPN
jgi:hypothetical protein